MKTLIVVDVQRDFCSPEGNLYIPEGQEVVPIIEDIIRNNSEINQVIFTLDWHTPEDQSFKKGPVHCIQFTVGAAIPNKLIEACLDRGFKSIDGKYNGEDLYPDFLVNTFDFFLKGDNPKYEECGAFENSGNEDFGIISLSSFSEESFSYVIPGNNIIVCGLFGDSSVLETAKNLIDIPEIGEKRVSMFLDGIRSIDGGLKLKTWMKENKIREFLK